MIQSDRYALLVNPRHGVPPTNVLPDGGFRRAKAAITSWPDYAPTPLLDLPSIADEVGIAALRIKHEGERFGLGSFKALGGAYAVSTVLARTLRRRGLAALVDHAALAAGQYAVHTKALTVTCATDGNHGRSVAWGAQRFHCRCVIFVHETVSAGRVAAIMRYGAEVIRVSGTYDDAVREANCQAKANRWFVVSDTSYPGYTAVPRDVMQGYRLMADEAADQWSGKPPTHVFIQAGVGGAATAVSIQLRSRFTPPPLLIVVEPEQAACLLASAKAGVISTVPGELATIMAGLACGVPSMLAWRELAPAAWAFMSVSDAAAVASLRRLADADIAIGESGVAGLAGLAAASRQSRAALHLTCHSRILLFGTEGVTDATVYDNLLGPRRS